MIKKTIPSFKTHIRNVQLFFNAIGILLKTSSLYTVIILTLSIASGLIAPLNTIVYQKFLDSLVYINGVESLSEPMFRLLLCLAAIQIMAYALNGILEFTKQVFSDKLDLYVTDHVLHKAIQLPMETFDNAEIYNHINAAISQTSSNCLGLLESISESVYALVKGLSFLYIIAYFSWQIAIISLISMLPLLRLSVKINKYWYRIYRNRVEKNRLIQYLKLLLIKNSCVKEIKLYNVGERIIDIIKSNFSSFLQDDTKVRWKFLIKKTSVQVLDNIVTFAVKIWLLILALYRNCSLGTVILYFNSLDDLKLSYNELMRQFASIQNSLQYMESLDVLESEKSMTNQIGESFDNNFHVIEFKNVSFKYPGSERYVLRNISIKLEKGKTYFVVGFNGSGKTTLIKLLLRLYPPTEGAILIDGKNIQDLNINDYYRQISAVFQDFVEYPFDVYENVVVRSPSNEPGRFDTVLNYVGMREFVENLPNKEHTTLMRDWTGGTDLSRGQWQKLAIARCIYGNSCISILDEPFSSIDAEAENNIIGNLRNTNSEKLMIYITHRFSSISITDQIVVLKDGEIVEKGTHEELIKNNNIYFKLYDSQKLETKGTSHPSNGSSSN